MELDDPNALRARPTLDWRKEADSRRAAAVALTGIVLLGLALRLPLLLHYQYSPDELLQLVIADGRRVADVIARLAWEPHPPLTYVLRHYLLMVGRGVVIQRMFSLLPGMLLIWVANQIGCRIDGKRLGLTAATLTAVGPGQILLSQVSRPYAFAQLAIAVALWMSLASTETPSASWRRAWPFALASAVALCSEYTSAVAVAALDAGLLCGILVAKQRWQGLRSLAIALSAQGLVLGWCYLVHARFAAANGAFHWWHAWAGYLAGGGIGAAVLRIGPFCEYSFGFGIGWVWVVMLVLGIHRLARINACLAAAVSAALCIEVGASAVGLIPLGPVRQNSPCQPLAVLAVASGLVEAARLLGLLLREARAMRVIRVGIALSAFPVWASVVTDLSRFPYLIGEFPVSNEDFRVAFPRFERIDGSEIVITDESSISYVKFYDRPVVEHYGDAIERVDAHGVRYFLEPGDWGAHPERPCDLVRRALGQPPPGQRVWFLHLGWPENAIGPLARAAQSRGVIKSAVASGNCVLFAIPTAALARSGVCSPHAARLP